jgi:amino acid transporter
MIVIGVSYGYLVEKLPVSGGEFAYAYYALGRYHAFFCGWFLTLGYMSIVALNASALALLAKFTLPSIFTTGHLYSIAGWDVTIGEVIVACSALILFAYLNIRGSSLSGLSQFIFCIGLIAAVVLLTVGMILHPSSSWDNLQPLFKPGTSPIVAIAAILAIAPWAYVGFDNIPQAAEEFDFHPRQSFKLMFWALICAGLTYSFLIIATGVGMPWMNAADAGYIWGTGTVIENAFGRIGSLVLTFAVMMGIFTGLNGFYVSSSRLLFAMGRAKVIPSSFGQLHKKYRTPKLGILFTMAACLIAPFFGRQVLLWVVDMAAIGVTIAYFYTTFAAYRTFKWSDQDRGEEKRFSIVAPGRKFISLLGVFSSIGFFLLLVVPGSPGFLGKPSWIALFVWVILGIIFFLTRYKEYKEITEDQLDYLIFGDHYGKPDMMQVAEPKAK